jgi:hypothetical protein
VNELINEYSLEVVLAYMHHIQDHAEHAVRALLRRVANTAIGDGLSTMKDTPRAHGLIEYSRSRRKRPPDGGNASRCRPNGRRFANLFGSDNQCHRRVGGV